MYDFKKKHSLEDRKKEADRIRHRYPDRIPVIVQPGGSNETPVIDKCKFLVPGDLTVGQFMYVIRKRIKLEPEKAIFMFINDSVPATAVIFSTLYDIHKDTDGFLYVTYSMESTFG